MATKQNKNKNKQRGDRTTSRASRETKTDGGLLAAAKTAAVAAKTVNWPYHLLSWHGKLRDKDPRMMEEIDQVIDAYAAGDLPNFSSWIKLHAWLCEQLPDFNVKSEPFIRYARKHRVKSA